MKATVEYIKSLGWKHHEYFSNRDIYTLKEHPHCTWQLFEHQGNIGMVYKNEMRYFDMTEEEVNRFTDIVINRENMFLNPKDYTLYEAHQNSVSMEYLIADIESRMDK